MNTHGNKTFDSNTYNDRDVAALVEAAKECARELSTVWAKQGQVNDNRHAVNARNAAAKLTNP